MNTKDVDKEANYLGLFLPKLVKACKKYRKSWRYIDNSLLELAELEEIVKEGSKAGEIERVTARDTIKTAQTLLENHKVHGEFINSCIDSLENCIKKYEVYGGHHEGVPLSIGKTMLEVSSQFEMMRNELLRDQLRFFDCLKEILKFTSPIGIVSSFAKLMERSISRFTYFLDFERFDKQLMLKLPKGFKDKEKNRICFPSHT